jgi:SAM-dependent methyltransferase
VSDSSDVNRRFWDERAPVHAASPDYGVERYVTDPGRLSDVVRFDLPLLGDVTGLRGVHLQCHIGTDTLSLSRLGASMTGLDFSPASIEQARLLADACGASIEYVVADVRDAPTVLDPESFDFVYTGIGALCWLPDIRAWASVVSRLLRPGGRLFVREGHPMMWAIDERASAEALVVGYPYFETAEAMVFDEPGTYVKTDTELELTVSHSWNHGIGEIVTALLDENLVLTQFVEHDSVPWNPFPDGVMHLGSDGEYRLVERPERLPLTFTLQARKPGG